MRACIGQLRRREDGLLIADRVELAATYWSRLAGLQFRRELPPGTALVILPCRSIHTCWVRFPIDVAFIDAMGSVRHVRRGVRPWRVVDPRDRQALAVAEFAAGTCHLEVGDRLQLSCAKPVPSIPRAWTAD